jgi:hypothetical protein
MLTLALLAQIAWSATPVVSNPAAPMLRARLGPSAEDTVRRRAHAIEISDGYAVRLKIHRISAFAMYPLFVAEYLSGNSLYDARQNGQEPSGFARSVHTPVAVTMGGLFVVNSVTGAWNLWEDRKNPKGRARRIIHTGMMLLADAGMVATAISAGGAKGEDEGGFQIRSVSGRNRHRNLAIVSMSFSAASSLMMLLWKG